MGMIIIVPKSWRCFECQWVHLRKALGERCPVRHVVSTAKYRLCVSHSVTSWLFATPWTVPARLLCPWNSPGQNFGGGWHSLFQGIFPTQGLNPGLLHCRWVLHCLSHQGSPFYFKVSAFPFHHQAAFLRSVSLPMKFYHKAYNANS